MNKSRQDLIQIARRKLALGKYSVEQREQIIRTIDLLMEMAQADDKTEENARASAKLFSNLTHHHNLMAIIQQQAAEMDALKRIMANLTSSLQMQVVLETIVTEATRLIKDAKDTHIFLYQEDTLKFGASLDSEGQRNKIYSIPRPNGMTYTVARQRQAIVVENLHNHSLFSDAPLDWAGSIVGMPVMLGETVVGVMNLARRSVGGFSESELRLLGLLADQAALAIMNARLHQSVASQAMSDILTGLPNRLALDARLENDVQRAARYQHEFAVLMIDLDGFKAINDTHGHGFGDKVLHDYSQFLASTRRSSDFLARYGGDELMMILPETSEEGAMLVAENIKKNMVDFAITLPDGSTCSLSVTGGIAVYPTHAKTASDLLRASDEALYRAKRQVRGGFLVADDFNAPNI